MRVFSHFKVFVVINGLLKSSIDECPPLGYLCFTILSIVTLTKTTHCSVGWRSSQEAHALIATATEWRSLYKSFSYWIFSSIIVVIVDAILRVKIIICLKLVIVSLMLTDLVEQVRTVFVTPNLVHAHGELIVTMRSNCLEMAFLLRFYRQDFFLDLFLLSIIFFGFLCWKFFVEISRLHLIEAHVCHVDSFIVRVRS